ncbi:MAG TPA: ATP-binding protein [Rhizomicrobium sp.]|nr:ATP-binding protein [Rhizomicrobium sp.]
MAKYSIGAKIFGAFVAMSLILAALGAAGYGVLSAAGNIAVTTFDGPLMAISYARAAHTDFTEMQVLEQRFERAAQKDRAAIAAQLEALGEIFSGDLDVVAERATTADVRQLVAEIAPLVQHWRGVRDRQDRDVLHQLDGAIDEKFDRLIELITDHSFVDRRQTVTSIARYKWASIAITLFALLLSAGIAFLLRSRIVRPLRSAALVADRIAKGELETSIPPGGKDETGALLKSMTVMQDSIRAAMTREKALRHSAENRLADALETSHEGVMLVAPGGRIAMSNGILRDFFPAIADQLMPGIQFDAALEMIQTQLKPSQATSEDIHASGHAELELADGRWLRMTGSATSEGGSIIFLSDFTAIKEREESLRRAKREAEEANASKNRFLANMSHELRTPLNAIIGFSEIIAGQRFGNLGNPRYLDYSQDILRSGRHLLAVINDVLDLSKSEAGRMVLASRETDMREVLQDCAAMVREQCIEAGLDLSMPDMAHPLPMLGDAAKLRQIFLNLLSNAIKFTERGGGVSLSAGMDADNIVVTIADTGIGMDPQDVEIALQPFGQVDNGLERRYEGTGLGLSLTKALVDLHKGAIAIDSARGKGTRITVSFPRIFTQELLEAI